MEKEQNSLDRLLTEQEEARLLMAAAAWIGELVTLAINTGMRLGEILALTWAGVDFTRRTVTAFRSKNGERRTIPINQTVLALLSGKYGEKTALMSSQNAVVISSEAATPLDGSNLRRGFTAALKAEKVEDFYFRDLRHTFATRLVQARVDLYKVQRLLGHKSPSMTQRYAHHYPESLRDGVEILDRGKTVSTNSAQRPFAPMVAL